MQLFMAGTSFKTAAVEVREKLSFEEKDLDEAYRLLLARKGVSECVILSTCNRVEIYAMMEQSTALILKDFITDYHKCSIDQETIFYWKSGSEAIRHICTVAAGLDSMVLGESQIFAQLKDAYAAALKRGAVKYTFKHLFTRVFSVVKKIRSKTAIGEKNVSVSYAAVRLAQSVFPDIKGKKVMILGAGEMGKLTVRNLIDAGIAGVMVVNRTFQKAVEIAERFGGIPVMLHEICEYLPRVDILISSILAPSYIITADMVEDLYRRGKSGSLFMVDISVPRSIDPRVSGLENVYLYNIDNLRSIVESNSTERQKEAQKAISLIEQKIPSLSAYLDIADLVPTLVSIRCKAEEIRKNSIAQMIDDISISGRQKIIIEEMTKDIVRKILYHSEIKLREYSNSPKIIKNDK